MGLISRYRNHNELMLSLLKKVYDRIKSDYQDLDTVELQQLKMMIKRLQELHDLNERIRTI